MSSKNLYWRRMEERETRGHYYWNVQIVSHHKPKASIPKGV